MNTSDMIGKRGWIERFDPSNAPDTGSAEFRVIEKDELARSTESLDPEEIGKVASAPDIKIFHSRLERNYGAVNIEKTKPQQLLSVKNS